MSNQNDPSNSQNLQQEATASDSIPDRDVASDPKLDQDSQNVESATLSLWHVIKSIAAGAIGVQSDKNRELDFSQTNVIPYIVVGIAFTIAFVAGLMFIVSLIV